jgi:hypothetical protein
MAIVESGIVEIRDHVLWPNHIRNAPNLRAWLLGLNSGEIVFLRIDGRVGVWQKMSDGANGRPTTGLKPGDARTREMWHSLFRERLHDCVRIEAPEVPNTSALVPTSLEKPNASRSRSSMRTTEIGYTNRNNQTVIRKTGVRGNDHNQLVYVLRCGACSHEYGANGSDIFQRRCPKHDGGAPGLGFKLQ